MITMGGTSNVNKSLPPKTLGGLWGYNIAASAG